MRQTSLPLGASTALRRESWYTPGWPREGNEPPGGWGAQEALGEAAQRPRAQARAAVLPPSVGSDPSSTWGQGAGFSISRVHSSACSELRCTGTCAAWRGVLTTSECVWHSVCAGQLLAELYAGSCPKQESVGQPLPFVWCPHPVSKRCVTAVGQPSLAGHR